MKHNLLGMSLEELEAFFISIKEKPFRSKQVFQWIHQKGESDFHKMTNLSKDLQSKLYEKGVSCPHCVHEKTNNQRTRFSERQRQVELAEKRNQKHIGARIN